VKALVLDAGALIALDDNSREVWGMIRRAVDEDAVVGIPSAVLAQVYRDGARQANLMRALKACVDLILDGETARVIGALCGQTGVDDVVDGSVVIEAAKLTRTSDQVGILTSDSIDIEALLTHLDADVTIVEV